jgi:hypothetical protein
MKAIRLCSAVLALTFSIACGGTTDLKPSPAGTWVAALEVGAIGSYQRSLTFGRDGSFTSEIRGYGVYEGQPENELSGWQRIEGTYSTEGDQIYWKSARSILWDLTDGQRIADPYLSDPYLFARYEIEGSQLVLRYTIYPFGYLYGNPEPAVTVFTLAP